MIRATVIGCSAGGVTLKEADEKELISSYHIYFAPPSYHLLVENKHTFSLSAEEKVLFARPSIEQGPQDAAYRSMPEGALKVLIPDLVLNLQQIGQYTRGMV